MDKKQNKSNNGLKAALSYIHSMYYKNITSQQLVLVFQIHQ
jgi:hypothetical protein